MKPIELMAPGRTLGFDCILCPIFAGDYAHGIECPGCHYYPHTSEATE